MMDEVGRTEPEDCVGVQAQLDREVKKKGQVQAVEKQAANARHDSADGIKASARAKKGTRCSAGSTGGLT